MAGREDNDNGCHQESVIQFNLEDSNMSKKFLIPFLMTVISVIIILLFRTKFN